MRVNIVKSANAQSFYIIKSIRLHGKSTSQIIEKLGTREEVIQKANGQDPLEWANQRATYLTELDQQNKKEIRVSFSNHKLIDLETRSSLNVGYLFLKKIYHELKLDQLCASIAKQSKIEFDLNGILASLLYARILYPASKLSSFESSKKFLETQTFDLHHVYRALDVLAKNNDLIQQHLYQASRTILHRNSTVLYYDCTNFFFEIEEARGLKQYGKSKENRPNPIIQMGLFLDGNGIPLAFDLTAGNTNEQTTLQPLEQRILSEFELSKFVVCTDAGLSSKSNRLYNSAANRAYVTVQSLKKLKEHLRTWALDPQGWQLLGASRTIHLSEIEIENNKSIYYKERWIHENGIEERLIVTFSPKHKVYQDAIRNAQIERALKQIEGGKPLRKNKNQNDSARFIQTLHTTPQGEVAQQTHFSLDESMIQNERQFDGFYGVVTNLEDKVDEIIKINQRRWEIEESFRIMKSEFKARPIYLQNDSRIEAHFLTCFMALTLFRILEKRLNEAYTVETLIKTLKEMDVHPLRGYGYLPLFQRTVLTDTLQAAFEFQLSTEIIDLDTMKKNKQISKKRKTLRTSEHI